MKKAVSQTSASPEVWLYSDYRKYLSDCVQFKKDEHSKFSYSYFAKALGTTKPYLKLVTSRKRNISIDKVLKVSNLFKHGLFERQYFVFLYLENVSEEKEIKRFFRSILKAYTPGGRPRHPVVEAESEDKYSAMRDWLALSICGLGACDHYQHNVEWIHSELGGDLIVSKKRIQDVLMQLEKNKVFTRDKNGTWKMTIPSEMRSAQPFDLDQNQVYKTGLIRCLLALDLIGQTDIHNPNYFFTNLIAVNEEDQKKVITLLENFEKDLWNITHSSKNPTHVMLLSNNLISLNGKPLKK